MNPIAVNILALALAYLLGAVPMGLLIARSRGVDIRAVGSGNIGATNVFRCVGKPWGLLTFILDALKGLIPALAFPAAAERLGGAPGASLGILCGCAAIVGHSYPIYLRFRGGKGIATSAGALLGAAPAAVGVGLAAWLLLFLPTGLVSLASIGCAAAVAVFSWWCYAPHGFLTPIVLTLLAAMIVWRHRSNIVRLLNGTEHRFLYGKKKETAKEPLP